MTTSRKTRPLTVPVHGDEREATWKEGVGVYVVGHNLGKGETVLFDEDLNEVADMRRMQLEGEPVTLIIHTQH